MASGHADWSKRVFTSANEEEQEIVAASVVEAAATFSKEVRSWIVYNDGPNPVHYSLATGVSTNNFKIPSKAWRMADVPATSIYFICAAGETATVYVVGLR